MGMIEKIKVHFVKNLYTKQKTIFSVPKIQFKDLVTSPWTAFVVGQLIFLIMLSLWQIVRFGGIPNFDVVLFPGLANLGFYSLSIGPFRYMVLKTFIVIIVNFVVLLGGYVFGRRYGKWILKWTLQMLVILNLAMIIYW